MIAIATAILMSASTTQRVIAFDCDTARIAGKPSGACENKLGRFIAAQSGPQVGGRPTIAVRYEPEWGTNLYSEGVALLQRRGQQYRVLWSHDVVTATAGLRGVPDEATVYVWTFDPGTHRIAVRGSRTVGKVLKIRTGEARGQRTRLPAETYCFVRASARFQRCRDASA
jgi:hypothetical protein